MLTIESLREEAQRAPAMAKVGVMGLLLAGLADVVAHLEVGGHVGHLHEHASSEVAAHIAAFVSMVVIYLGVVLDGARRHRARAARGTKGVA